MLIVNKMQEYFLLIILTVIVSSNNNSVLDPLYLVIRLTITIWHLVIIFWFTAPCNTLSDTNKVEEKEKKYM